MTTLRQAQNILVIQLRQVGDVLLTTPAVKVLRDHYPASRITFLTETGPAQLLEGNPHLDAVITRSRKNTVWQDWQLAHTLRRAHFDLVIDFFCNPRSAWLTFLTGAPQRIASHHAWRTWWYTFTPKIQGGVGYAATDKLALLHALGIGGELVPPVLTIPPAAQAYIADFFSQQQIHAEDTARPLITIDLTSRRQARRWVAERYVQMADRLVEKYQAHVIFIWGPGEQEDVAALVAHAQHPQTLACPTNLMQLAALIARARLHIGNCSAPRHLAVAVNTPSLTIMGPTIPANWTYPAPMHRVIQGNVPCLGCHHNICAPHTCMNALTVQEVEHAAAAMLAENMR